MEKYTQEYTDDWKKDYTEIIKKPFYKRRVFIIPMVVIMLIALVSAATVYYSSIHVTLTVNEALSMANVNVTFDEYPGNTVVYYANVTNHADNNITTFITWNADTSSDASVDIDVPQYFVIEPGNHLIPIVFSVAPDSELGTISGNLIFARVAN